MIKLLLSIAVGSVILMHSPARAWSEASHMTTGAIAFDDLSVSDPAVMAELKKILTAHPHYDKLVERAEGLSDAEQTRLLFQWLARWPDDIRDTEFSRPSWHYELRVVSGWTWVWPFRNGDASIGFEENFRTLADPDAPVRDRAIAVSWLMHIVGDIQQPLHAGHQMTSTFSATDEAGTISYVRKKNDGTVANLHEFWDQILDKPGAPEATSDAWAKPLQDLWPRTRIGHLTYSGTPQSQFNNWLDESMHLARLVGYTGTALVASAEPDDAPAVTFYELRRAEELSKRRIATGGYRIADMLRLALR